MDKKKETEKLVQVMAEYSCNRECNTQCEKRGYCHIKTFAENLVDQGYGNVKQAVKEFADELKERYFNIKNSTFDTVQVVGVLTIDRLFTELYGED